MKTSPYLFPLGIQTVLPEQYREDAAFRKDLETLPQLGFSHVELNMAHPQNIDLADVTEFLKEFDLEMSMFASGLTAKTSHLSLSSADQEIRERSVTQCKEMIDFVEGTGAGIIVGFLKGGTVQDREQAKARFAESLQAISPYTADKQVKILVEATNRYESSVANSLEDAVECIRDLNNPYMRILPDTYHMNIEEADSFAALTKYAGYYDSIHISDNTRYFPGFGAIKFDKYVQFLQSIGYTGGLAIEGNIQKSFIEDVTRSVEYLRPFLSK